MIFFPESGLHRQLIFYIVFIGLVFMTMAIEMIFFLKGETVFGALCDVVSIPISEEMIGRILLKTGGMLGILLLSIGLVMLLFTKRIMFPLSRIIEGTRAMSQGDFSITLPDHSRDELGELARHINDLTANNQELVMLARNMTEQTRDILRQGDEEDRINAAVEVLDDLDETLAEFGKSLYKC